MTANRVRDDWARWQGRLAELAQRHRVPAAALAVLVDGEVLEAATGVLNVATGVEATTDSLFQIGSITKVYTTSLIMQLVEQGQLDLDEPVVERLEEFRLADPETARRISTRHLLTHTSGMEGDHIIDTGRGEDAVVRYVATCAQLPMTHPVGAICSYCNSGFVVAGRLIEVLTGRTWYETLRTRLLDPLGLRHTTGLPEEAIRFRVAVGHDVKQDAPPQLVSPWMLPASLAPAGSTLCASAGDLIAFARMHLEGGRAVLSAESVAAMQSPQVAVPDPWTFGSHWGLGWILFDWNGRRVVGHDGESQCQSSFLRLVPDAGVAVALLANGGRTRDLYQDLYRELMDALCGISMPDPLRPPAEPVTVDLARYIGTYARVANRIELTQTDGGLAARIILTGPLAELTDDPVSECTLVPVAENLFVTRLEETWTPVVFYALPDGTRYLHLGGRATPLVTTGSPTGCSSRTGSR